MYDTDITKSFPLRYYPLPTSKFCNIDRASSIMVSNIANPSYDVIQIINNIIDNILINNVVKSVRQ